MYINLKDIRLNYVEDTIDDFMIVSEICDSTMSYEKPVLVRTVEELDIWFGKSFTERDWMVELIGRGVVLYLYRPLSILSSKNADWVDIDAKYMYQEELRYETIPAIPGAFTNSLFLVTNRQTYTYYSTSGIKTTKFKDTDQVVPSSCYYCMYPVSGSYVLLPYNTIPASEQSSYTHDWIDVSYTYPEFLPETGQEVCKYKVLGENVFYLWIEDGWVSEKDLPQNINNISESLDNRDTLFIGKTTYCHPEYRTSEEELGVYSHPPYSLPAVISSFPNQDNITKGYSTLAFEMTGNYTAPGFIVVSKAGETGITSNTVSAKPGTYTADEREILEGAGVGKIWSISDLAKFKNDVISSVGYTIDSINPNLVYSWKPIEVTDFNTMENFKLVPDWYTTQNIIMQGMVKAENQGIEFWSKTIGRDSNLYDDDSLIKVLIEKVPMENGVYRITISRYDYSEVYEGSIFPTESNEERLDFKISRESKLVYCNFRNFKTGISVGKTYTVTDGFENSDIKVGLYSSSTSASLGISKRDLDTYVITLQDNTGKVEEFTGSLLSGSLKDEIETKSTIISHIEFLNLTTEIQTGEFTMRRAKTETYKKEMYWKAFDCLFSMQDEAVCPDYFLVPFINDWMYDLDSGYNYYKEYQRFLEVAKELNMQVLIQNNPTKYKFEIITDPKDGTESDTIYKYGDDFYVGPISEGIITTDKVLIQTAMIGGDFVFNYLKDAGNYLQYFFNSMTWLGYPRPAYYVYLSGLLRDSYSVSTVEVNYDIPITDYTETPIETSLKKYKSNFLSNNNQIYYYKEYQNGTGYETTGWMRFAIGKIGRELQKNRWSYLGEKAVGKIIKGVTGVLARVEQSFSIIRKVELEDFATDLENNAINLSITTEVTDLVNNNIDLDITINYKSLK